VSVCRRARSRALVAVSRRDDRIALAYPGNKGGQDFDDISGVAIWASVSEEVDARIRDQIRAGTFAHS
jgi:cobalamin biosynthesis protein CbiD